MAKTRRQTEGQEVNVKRRIQLSAALILVACCGTPAFAQALSDKWEVVVAPYFMGAAMSGSTAVRGREVDVDLSASDIFSSLQFGAMGLVVARKGNWGLGGDAIWMALGTTVRQPGDALSLTFDSAVKSLRQLDVSTYLDTPESPVTLKVAMQSLPDGTRYPGSVVLGMPARQIEVRITNSNYQRLAQ
jgi:hypothetical protein